jgi:hypothetical protein
LLRPASLHLTTILSLIARFAEAGIPIAVNDQVAVDQLLSDVAHLPTDSAMPIESPRDAAPSCARTALLARRPPHRAASDLAPDTAPCPGAGAPEVSR